MGSQRVRHDWVTDHTQKNKQCLLQNWESIRQYICSLNSFCWSIVALQGYITFCCTVKWISYMYTYCYCCSVTKLCRIPCNPWATARQISLSFTISQSLLKLLSTELMMPSNHLILCHPLLHLPSIIPSIRVFSNELAVGIRWPEYWSFSISSSNEYSGLISFRIDWFDVLAVQGTLKSLLQQSLIRHPHCLNPYLTDVRKHKQSKPKRIVTGIQIEHEHLTTRNCIHFSSLKGLEFNWVRHSKELQNHLGEFMSKS